MAIGLCHAGKKSSLDDESLTGGFAKHRVAGWVAGGCWDDDITSDGLDQIIPENSLLSTSKKL